ncbi:MarR family winged helix-turn-helix transcriptional regulator [Actinomycetospora callitridis]|uniref:MarR family winged helix-turn-helix transcriptional regulator n=1 Tax=Actinomycetospora callitridis TaxID=913944 RepID=UPI002364FC61|nr:MarR family transcriptional regulator [Actinomycetospora callitridis]MDD7921925.1 MarR family transcriptional regulator [Actinomycetospora callitridis]
MTAPIDQRLATAAALDAFAAWAIRSTAGRELSLTTASTLATLDRDGPQRLSDLAVREGVTQPSMTALVTRLERDGLATRGPDPSDGRAVVVTLTDAGREVLTARRTRRASRLAELLDHLEPDERAAVDAAAGALSRLTRTAPSRGVS